MLRAMPEYPDITVYIERLDALLTGQILEGVRLPDPFLLRTADPPVDVLEGRLVSGFGRIGKRIFCAFEDELYLVIHLMIAGRLHWKSSRVPIPRRGGLAALDFAHGSILMTESATRRQASWHVVEGRADLLAFNRGGLEVFEASPADFKEALKRESHTLKRALTDPRLLSGIGNAYSDEILHRARLSPLALTGALDDGEISRLFAATKEVLAEWTDRLRAEVGEGFPAKVTAFRPEMAVHGRYGKPCPTCGSAVQRIRYASRETDYCPLCQTGGRLLADRSLSRLLKKDWPRTLEELEGGGEGG